jgi:hypothetical protein
MDTGGRMLYSCRFQDERLCPVKKLLVGLATATLEIESLSGKGYCKEQRAAIRGRQRQTGETRDLHRPWRRQDAALERQYRRTSISGTKRITDNLPA